MRCGAALLYAASVGQQVSGTLMLNRICRICRICRSDDGGASRIRLGDAACIFFDETEPSRSQVLKLTSTRDGLQGASRC